MKKYFTLWASFAMIAFSFSAKAQTYQWATSGGGGGTDNGTSITTDISGFSYICGTFTGSATFGTFNLVGTGSYLAKYDPNGVCQWAVRFNGNVESVKGAYITGWYMGSATFGTTTLNSAGGTIDIFIAKFAPATGNFIWASSAGSAFDDDHGTDISFDNFGYPILTGYFWDQATFDLFGTITGTQWETFIARYDDNTGNCMWAVAAGGNGNQQSNSIQSIGNTVSYITGHYSGTAIFGSTTLTSVNGFDDIFVAKYDAAIPGWVWARSVGGTNWDYAKDIVRVNASSDMYITGEYQNSITFGTTTLTSAGATDVFTARIDLNGNWVWARSGGGTGYDYGNSIISDNTGCYGTGRFSANATFGTTNLTGAGDEVFVTHYDGSGNLLWAIQGGGAQADNSAEISSDGAGREFITGSYTSAATFGMYNVTAVGTQDVFISEICAISANAGSDVSICTGASTPLSASGGNNYSWSPASGLSNPNISNPVASPTVTITYTVTVTNTLGCTATDAVTVTVNPLPSANAGSDVSICAGSSTQLNASGGGTYSWAPSTGLSNTGISNPVATPTITTNYTVTVTSPAGCTATDVVTVTVNPLPTANAGTNVSICTGASTNLNATGGGTYAWSPTNALSNPNIANPVASPTITVTYTVTVTSPAGCTDTDAVTVTVNPLPSIVATAANITCSGGSVQLSATGGNNYVWTPATGLNNPNIANPVATVTSSTIYTVTGTDANGCVNTDTAAAIVYQLSNAICMVTVDTNSAYNQVVWEKPVTTNIDSFRIYREITSNNFQVIGSVPYSAYSVYVDSVYVPIADPNNTNYRYKISVIDTCGAEGPLSPFHRTIFLQANQGVGNVVNLNWVTYQGNIVNQYYIYRDTVGTGNLDLIDSVPGTNTVYTDNNPSQNVTTLRYVLGVDWGLNCNPTVRYNGNQLLTINTSHSNIKNLIYTPDAIVDIGSIYSLNIFPNPNNGTFSISLRDLNVSNCNVTVFDELGQVVFEQEISSGGQGGWINESFDLTSLSNGVYSVKVDIDGKQAIRKLIIQ